MILTDGDAGNDLTSAAAKGDVSAVRRILEEDGVHPDTVNEFGRTALQVMMMGSAATARLLLQHGASANVQDAQGITPAHDAARAGFADTLAALVHFGASVNAPDRGGALPIHVAIREGHTDAVRFLAPRSDLGHRDRGGDSALELARARWPDAAELLQRHPATGPS